MSVTRIFSAGLFAIIATLAVCSLTASPADARGGRDYYLQDYKFEKPMHGFEGRAAGGYFCSYQRLPNRVCTVVNGAEKCTIKGWTLRQHCY